MNRPATTARAPGQQEQTVPDQQTVPDTDPLLRVLKGSPTPEELAALTALLLARTTAPDDDTGAEGPEGPGPAAAGWRRPERRSGFPDPRTWQGPRPHPTGPR